MLVGANSSRDAALWVYGPFYACVRGDIRVCFHARQCAAARLGLTRRAGGRGRAHPCHGRPLLPRPERSRISAGRSRAIRAPERQVRYGRRRCRVLTVGNLTPSAGGLGGRVSPVGFRGVP